MSFGWSAGDIAQAITIVVKTAKALDQASGAPANYREDVAFLGGLMRTLEPLHAYTTLGARPSYQNEIKQHVSNIKHPIESFLSTIAKYEPSLGANALPGYHRNICTKLKWRFVISKSVIDLRQEIQDHMLLLDCVLQRLTVDLLVDVQRKVGGPIRNVLSDALDPRLVSIRNTSGAITSRPNDTFREQPHAEPEESSSLPPNSTKPTRLNVSFLFTVNRIVLNEEPSNRGVAPIFNDPGWWSPPIYQAGFASEFLGTLYRWQNGVVTQATEYQWSQGAWWGPDGVAGLYRANTMFYCNPFDQFLAAEGDASDKDMADAPCPSNLWLRLYFRHQSALSRLDLGGSEPYLAGKTWSINQLGLNFWYNPNKRAPLSSGLAGNLALLIALVAFSCRYNRLDTILQTSWRDHAWQPHHYSHDGPAIEEGLL
ncbi:hypothetical protein LOCC1_G007809 [Lachnellula occidentalis]|uniref:NACHT-NTPase and P-loop NTPases N-terminal domain-containing protein n=1 Tax=Lachnellula occidentalis TaxID=215460 RepID=A0A8H8RGQ0_9HELO|nr:hypothetical protein LOCC1_G007809 [Lachnellula occidentalis]